MGPDVPAPNSASESTTVEIKIWVQTRYVHYTIHTSTTVEIKIWVQTVPAIVREVVSTTVEIKIWVQTSKLLTYLLFIYNSRN